MLVIVDQLSGRQLMLLEWSLLVGLFCWSDNGPTSIRSDLMFNSSPCLHRLFERALNTVLILPVLHQKFVPYDDSLSRAYTKSSARDGLKALQPNVLAILVFFVFWLVVIEHTSVQKVLNWMASSGCCVMGWWYKISVWNFQLKASPSGALEEFSGDLNLEALEKVLDKAR